MLEKLQQMIDNVNSSQAPLPAYNDWITLPDQFVETYARFVGTLAKEMGSDVLNMLHAAVGVSGEAGELLDAIKKLWVYQKPYDEAVRENLIEELGDLEFYMQALRLVIGASRQEVLDYNCKKLGQRYAAGYSDAAAIARADKQGVSAESSIVSAVGEPLESSQLQVIDMSKVGRDLPVETLMQNDVDENPMPEWLQKAITDNFLHTADVTAWNIHKNTATVLTVNGEVKKYYKDSGA